tara:strand:- start:136 stop:606 length:471 start_codon:yes stop_codon:yes gene_type:complete
MSRAVTLAELADQAVFSVNGNTNFVGIGSTLPVVKLDVNGNAAVSGTTTSLNLVLDGGANISGVVTASSFTGDGSNLTGVSGFATALSSTQTDPLFHVFKTPRNLTVSAGSSLFIESDASSGNIAFTKMGHIHVSSGATVHVGSGTTFVTNVLSLF